MDQLAVTQVGDVYYLDQFDGNARIRGTLHLTLSHTFFIGSSRKQEIWLSNQLIASVERLPLTTSGAPLIIRGKDFRTIRLIILKERDCHDVYRTLIRLARVESLSDLPCFRCVPPDCYWSRAEGWFMYSLNSQFDRFGLPNSEWVLTNVNKNYEVCDTYPSVLCVPSITSKNVLIGSARFRSRGRFPVLTYLHPNGKSALCRCSQPLAGFSSKSTEDQILLEAIRNSNPNSSTLYVVDTRPTINALTNRAQGKGYEDTNVYRNISIQFFDIENIHVVRTSLEKVLKVCNDPAITVEHFASGLEKSGWLKHLRAILEAAYFVAKRMNEGNSVLVHCSDGWDRTAQVCSLAQIILDPFYRTLTGLQALIEKDWILFGHKFTERCGLDSTTDSREISPIFTQFLDCIRHLIEFCPTKFEYSTKLLAFLHDQAYAANFGTFVGCSEKERLDLKIYEKTYSLWMYLNKLKHEWINPFYEHNSIWTEFSTSYSYLDTNNLVTTGIELIDNGKGRNRFAVDMLPVYTLYAPLFHLWRDLYLRWEWRLPKYESKREDYISDCFHGLSTLINHNRLLEERIVQLCKLLGYSIDQKLPNELINKSVVTLDKQISLTELENLSISNQKNNSNGNESLSNHPLCKSNANSSFYALQIPSLKQLKSEIDFISLNWNYNSGANSSCANCNILLVLVNRSVHCHSCGEQICSRCINPKHYPIPGLWSLEQNFVQMCNQCASKLRASGSKHYTEIKPVISKKLPDLNCLSPQDSLKSTSLLSRSDIIR